MVAFMSLYLVGLVLFFCPFWLGFGTRAYYQWWLDLLHSKCYLAYRIVGWLFFASILISCLSGLASDDNVRRNSGITIPVFIWNMITGLYGLVTKIKRIELPEDFAAETCNLEPQAFENYDSYINRHFLPPKDMDEDETDSDKVIANPDKDKTNDVPGGADAATAIISADAATAVSSASLLTRIVHAARSLAPIYSFMMGINTGIMNIVISLGTETISTDIRKCCAIGSVTECSPVKTVCPESDEIKRVRAGLYTVGVIYCVGLLPWFLPLWEGIGTKKYYQHWLDVGDKKTMKGKIYFAYIVGGQLLFLVVFTLAMVNLNANAAARMP